MHQQQQPSREGLPNDHEETQPQPQPKSKNRPRRLESVTNDKAKTDQVQQKIVHKPNNLHESSSSIIQSPSSSDQPFSGPYFKYFFNKLYFIIFKQPTPQSLSVKKSLFFILALPILLPFIMFYTVFILFYFLIVWVIFIPFTVALAETAKHYILLKLHPSCWFTLLLPIAIQFIPLCIFILYVYRLVITLCSQAFRYDMKILFSGHLSPILRGKPFLGDNYDNMQEYLKEQNKYQCQCVCCCQNCQKCELAKTKYPNRRAPITQMRIWCMFYQKQSSQFPLLKKLRIETKEQLKSYIEKLEIQENLKKKAKEQKQQQQQLKVKEQQKEKQKPKEEQNK